VARAYNPTVDYTMGGASLGASIGSAVPVVGTAVGAGVGALVGFVGGGLKGWWNRAKDAEQRGWAEREAIRQQEKFNQTANLQTEAQRQIMNRQLNENINTLNINKAGMGAYRTGGRIKDIEKMQTTMNEDVARVAQANSLNAMLAGMGLKQSQQQLDIQMAQLELAKQAGDTDMMSGIAEQIGGSDFFSKLLGGNKGESVPSNPSPYGQTESNLNSAPSSYNNAIGTQPNTLTLADYIMPSQSGVSIPSQDNYNLYSGQGTGFNAPYSTVDYGIQSSGLTSEEAIGFTDTEWDDWWGRQY
jgi:hypothetical protein